EAALHEAEEKLKRLESRPPADTPASYTDLIGQMAQFLSHKKQELVAAGHLDQSSQQVTDKLTRISSTVADTADTMSVDALAAIKEAIETAKTKASVDGLSQQEGLDKISTVTNQAVSQIRSVLDIRVLTTLLDHEIKQAVSSRDWFAWVNVIVSAHGLCR
ncbi:hypothetical protein ACFL3F_05650, partial [Planctomycetota bacterium]